MYLFYEKFLAAAKGCDRLYVSTLRLNHRDWRWNAKSIARSCSGSAAVEFALVSVPFVFTLMLVACLGLILFMRQQFDYAAVKAARQVMNGTVQQNAYNGSDFRTHVICSYLPAVFSCNDVIVNLQTVTKATRPDGYYRFLNSNGTGIFIPQLTNSSAQYNAGAQGSYEYLQIVYPVTFLPSFVTSLFSSQIYNGTPAYLIVATAAFRNEQY